MNIVNEDIGKCPHSDCGGRKVRETFTYQESPYPPSQTILGPGGKNQLQTKTKITIYCTKCFSIFRQ